ncbi:hypothetical protein DL96DRAFT_1821638 [Flagelloscypha sp. PMI_526]|nr:hypothetical protein DL96DRAFT_1821638 [Flagelloscypha sp. PMI_526]
MRPSQPNGLPLSGTLGTHGHLRTRSELGQNTSDSASNIDAGLDAGGTLVQLAKDAVDATCHVPYVKAVTSILSQVMRIRDEIEANQERCNEIIDLVLLKSTTILQSLDTVYRANGAGAMKELKSDLGSVQRLVAISIDARKILNRLQVPESTPPLGDIPQALPASPEIFIGRDTVVTNLVQTILSSSKPRVAILGPGGIGKTAIGTSIVQDPRITSAYPTKYFVSSELSPTVELLENHIADALSIPQRERGKGLVSRIVDAIHLNPNPIFLFIDNLETVWEVENEQSKVDRFLDVLSGAGSKLAILDLDSSNAIAMFEKWTRQPADAAARELLSKFSGSPLAIKLFALMVKNGDKPSQLLSSWKKHGAKTLEIGGKHRLSSLEQSIHLSVFSPRIDDNGRLVLGLIALLPDGLSSSSPWFEGFESALPDNTSLDPNSSCTKAQFCFRLNNSASPAVTSLVELYIKTLTDHWNYTSSTSQHVIIPEMANIRGILLLSAHRKLILPSIGKASAKYADWARWQNIDDSVTLTSVLRLPIPSHERAGIYISLGSTHTRWDRLDAAEKAFTRALELYREAQNPLGEANTHKSIGSIHVRRARLSEAETSFSRSLELYRTVRDRLGEAKAHQAIGNIHVRRDRLDAAEASFTRALELFRTVQDRLGKANTYECLGTLHVRRDRLVTAEANFTRALELYSEVQDRLGQANTHRSIGDLHLRQDRLTSAEASFTRALQLYREIQSRLGEANAQRSYSELHLRRDKLDAAEKSLKRASELFVETQSQPGSAYCAFFLGKVYTRRLDLDKAMVAFSRALTIWQELGDSWGIAKGHQAIGELHLHRAHLDNAETSLHLALDIYTTKVEARPDEALTNRSIGELYLRRSHFDDCERVLRRALELDVAASSRVGQAQSHWALGRMFVKKGDHGPAESSYSKALQLFFATDDYQATLCLLDLGKVWALQGKIEESQASNLEILRAYWN